MDSLMLVEKATEATKITCWNPVQPGGESNCMKKEITRWTCMKAEVGNHPLEPWEMWWVQLREEVTGWNPVKRGGESN
jgi:hypothetical protein